MPTSLFDADVQSVIDQAKQTAGTSQGPFPSPEDWRDNPIYFLMIDRFNNSTAKPVHTPFDDPAFGDFQGGKFSGVEQKLAYIKALGTKAIWLSPPLKNLPFCKSYHGYGIHDFIRAEPRFADVASKADDELRHLVDAAHAMGLYVIFDIVLNHTGDVFAYQGEQPDHTTSAGFSNSPMSVQWRDATGQAQNAFGVIEQIPLNLRSPNSLVWPSELQQNRFFRRQGLMGGSSDDTIGDFSVLKQMLTDDADLQHYLIRAYQYVIARFDIDGFRIDTLRYLKGDLARLFGNSIREFALSIGKQNFFTFGEVFDNSAEVDIAKFIGRNTADAGDEVGVDAALDFPVAFKLKSISKGLESPADLVATYQFRKQVEQNILSSHGDATRFFVTFVDNHDWKERIHFVDPANPTRFDDQVTLAIACLYALPGIPCVYYGTEFGLRGSGTDEAVREALWGLSNFSQTTFFYQHIANIGKVRAARPSLRYGRFYFRPVSGDGINFAITTATQGVLAFSRILNDEEVIIVANTNSAPNQTQAVDVIVDGTLNPPNSPLKILYSNKAAPTAPSAVRTTGQVVVHEVDGSIGHGPLEVVHVSLQPMEVQIIAR
jgi:glycosidase